MKQILFTIFLAFYAMSAIAHQDRVISINDDWSLNGLPEMYSPASLRDWRFTVGTKVYKFPECFVKKMNGVGKEKVSLKGSWYHVRSSLPHYISIGVASKNIFILFSLESVKPIDWIGETVVDTDGNKIFREITSEQICEIVNSKKNT